MATYSAAVAKVTDTGFSLVNPSPPPPTLVFTPVTDRQWAIANACPVGGTITVTTDEEGKVTGVSRP